MCPAEQEAASRTLSQADCLIAAAAQSIGARLATGNPKDFSMRALAVEHWPAGAYWAELAEVEDAERGRRAQGLSLGASGE